MSAGRPTRGRHARRGTFARDVTVGGVLFLVAALAMFFGLTALVGGDGSTDSVDPSDEVVVAGVTVTSSARTTVTGPPVTTAAPPSTAPSSTAPPVTAPTSLAPATVAADTTVPGSDPSSTVVAVAVQAPSEIRIRVLNAVGTNGLASRMTERLADLGYQMLEPDDASRDASQSRILFRDGFGPAAFELREHVPDALVELADLDEDIDIVVELGASFREE